MRWRTPIKPDFLFVGAAKCGSTWFFRALRAHPQVFVPPAKDIYYFDQHYERGPAWYESFFDAAGTARALGEVSHNYLYSAAALERIDNDLPGVKLIACLRDPVARAFSAYLFMRRNGTAAESLRQTLLENPRILERGLYADYVERCYSRFGRDRVRVFLFDELQADAAGLARDLYAFIGVDPEFEYGDAGRKALPASRARFQWLATAAKKGARLVRGLGYPGLVGRLKATRVTRLLYKPLDDDAISLSADDRNWLRDYFAADVKSLQSLLDRDLGAWLCHVR